MRKNKKTYLVAMLVLQVFLLFAVNRFFVSDMKEDINLLEQKLSAEGMPPKQIDAIVDVMSHTRISVSFYGLQIAVIAIVASNLIVMLKAKDEEQSS